MVDASRLVPVPESGARGRRHTASQSTRAAAARLKFELAPASLAFSPTQDQSPLTGG